MKTRNDCEIACDCVKRADVVLHVGLCREIFARKHTATHKPTSAQPLTATSVTSNNRLWSPWGLRPSGANIYWHSTYASGKLKTVGSFFFVALECILTNRTFEVNGLVAGMGQTVKFIAP